MLLVDDEPTLRFEINRLLTSDGTVVFEAESGAEGLNKAVWVEPHLTIVDWEMPVMNGPKFIETLKKSEQGKRSKILLMTEKGKKQPVGKSVKPLVNEVVSRPFNDSEFRTLVKSLLPARAVVGDERRGS